MNTIAMTWTFLVLGQTADGGAPSAAAVNSILDFLYKGGPMMIPIAACSLFALTVIIERLLGLRKNRVIPHGFVDGLRRAHGDRKDDHEAALEYCRSDASPIANIVAAGIRRFGESPDRIEKSVQEAGEREISMLRKYFRSLSVVASIAPLMGLLGTIFGMIIAFQTVATAGEALGKAELLARGIYQAMITTAAGLSLAIPVMIAYHYLSSKVERLVLEMDQMAIDFLEDCGYGERSDQPVGPTFRATETEDDARDPKSVTSAASA